MDVEVLVGRPALAALADLDRPTGEADPSSALPQSGLPAPTWTVDAWTRMEPAITPVALVLSEGGRRRGALALGIRHRRGIVELVAAGHPVVDLVRWSTPDRDSQAIATGLARALAVAGRRATLRLEQLAADEPWIPILSEILGRRPAPGQTVVATRLGTTRDLTTVASRNYRRQARQVERRLQASGHVVETKVLVEADAIADALPAVDALRAARDRSLGRRTPFDGGPGGASLRSAIADAGRRGALEVITITIDDELAAYDLGLLDDAVYRVVDGRIGPGWSTTTIGMLADRALVISACQHREITWIDWGRGLGMSKERLGTDLVETVDLVAWNSSTARVLGPDARAARRHAQETLARHPAALAAWRRAKGQLARMRPTRT
jgi:hypothetical protein